MVLVCGLKKWLLILANCTIWPLIKLKDTKDKGSHHPASIQKQNPTTLDRNISVGHRSILCMYLPQILFLITILLQQNITAFQQATYHVKDCQDLLFVVETRNYTNYKPTVPVRTFTKPLAYHRPPLPHQSSWHCHCRAVFNLFQAEQPTFPSARSFFLYI